MIYYYAFLLIFMLMIKFRISSKIWDSYRLYLFSDKIGNQVSTDW